MAEKKSEHKRLKNQYKYYDMVLKERMAKEIGAFLTNLLDKGYMSRSAIKSEDTKYILDKEEQLAEVHRLTEDYKSIYGIEATCVLELTRKNIDLRNIVKTKSDGKPYYLP